MAVPRLHAVHAVHAAGADGDGRLRSADRLSRSPDVLQVTPSANAAAARGRRGGPVRIAPPARTPIYDFAQSARHAWACTWERVDVNQADSGQALPDGAAGRPYLSAGGAPGSRADCRSATHRLRGAPSAARHRLPEPRHSVQLPAAPIAPLLWSHASS